MKSIIVGAGKIGFALASNLCQSGHEVTVIDSDQSRLDIMEEHLNISILAGNAARLETLEAADAADSDLIIAVTDKDELNMVTCFLARRAGVKSAIARVRAPGYHDLNNVEPMSALGVDLLINPERITAQEIAKLIDYPEASYVGYLGRGQLIMLELKLTETCRHLDERLMDLNCPVQCIIMGIDRGGQLLIPRGGDLLLAGDEVLILTATKDVRKVEAYLGITSERPRDIAIMGGSLSAYYLAEMLEKRRHRYNVKLFAPDQAESEEMARRFQRTAVIHASPAAAISMFEDENIGDSDMLISLSEDDKDNLFASVVGRHLGAGMTIAQIRGEYARLIEKAGVDRVVSPSSLSLNSILTFINRSRMLSLTRFVDSPGQVSEYLLSPSAPAVGRTIMELSFPLSALICMIIRNGQHIIPRGSDRLEAGDSLVVFSLPEALDEVEALFTTPAKED